ncbi:uncharacterized protein LOC113353198 [Papaver somniferum]|uniref:uncharacterized protein LOC113353198 n=1 Tax=Papaver somniferum TaxID=3469 RepID=UPI000E6F5524|nr:uncharacterized protein LOC113353198 [Papaver somniferum]
MGIRSLYCWFSRRSFPRQQQIEKIFCNSYPDSHSKFASHHQTGFCFSFLNPIYPHSTDQERMNLFILGSSSSLVLCTTCHYNSTTYYVCNPLTKKCVSLPPPPPRENNLVAATFICDESFSESTSYKVIRIPKFQTEAAIKELKVDIFFSDVGEWNVYNMSCPAYVTWKYTSSHNYFTHNGVLYWFPMHINKIIAVNINRNTSHGTCGNECRLINIPEQVMDDCVYSSRHVGESEGLICLDRFNNAERSLSVWVLDAGDWYMLHKDIKLHEWLAKIESQLINDLRGDDLASEIQVVSFSPVDKNVVILGYGEYVWAYNTKTRVYEQLWDPYFPRENLQFFPYRLGTLAVIIKPRPTILPMLKLKYDHRT